MKELGGTNGLSRRDFLKSGLVFGVGAQALASGYAAVPDVFARAVLSAKNAAVQNDKVLVMIQLGGGNDGLQTVIPISSSSYRDFRPQLSAAAEEPARTFQGVRFHMNCLALARSKIVECGEPPLGFFEIGRQHSRRRGSADFRDELLDRRTLEDRQSRGVWLADFVSRLLEHLGTTHEFCCPDHARQHRIFD